MLTNKVVVITGGAGLLGQEFVKAILENNGKVIIADINESLGSALKSKLKKDYKSEIDFFTLDICNKDNINQLIHFLDTKYGKIDALVNNAYPRNSNYGRRFEEVEYQDFCENINLNLGGAFLCSQLFLKYFTKQGSGNIVNISSVYGVIAPRFEVYDNTPMTMPVEYAAIKSALLHLTKYLAKYYKGRNIRINAICPGGIYDHQPATFFDGYKTFCLNKGMLNQSDIKGTLIYLLSDMSMFVNGQNIIVDDGFSL